VEEKIAGVFPGARVFRLDQDSSRKKGAVFDLMEKMNNGEIDILLGTQMVAKGFDFPGVTLVGVLLADIGMNLPDFRATERVFSLLIQAAGRSGRGDAPGRVIIQTLKEDHELFRFIRNQDYYGFYRYELSVRKSLDYPPFTRMARLLVRGRDEKKVAGSIDLLTGAIRTLCGGAGGEVKVLGPSSAPFEKIGGNYRHHIILKSKNVKVMREIIRDARNAVTGRDVYLEIDIDPYDIL
jgi:primosomal protein N' (replication factor Y) (superfamily II helicase)